MCQEIIGYVESIHIRSERLQLRIILVSFSKNGKNASVLTPERLVPHLLNLAHIYFPFLVRYFYAAGVKLVHEEGDMGAQRCSAHTTLGVFT